MYGEGQAKAFSRLKREVLEAPKDLESVLKCSVIDEGTMDSLGSRLFGIINQEQDRLSARFNTLPEHPPALASIKNTSTYHRWAEKGDVLHCSTEDVTDPVTRGSLAAIAMLDFANSKDKSKSPPNILYYDAATGNDDTSTGYNVSFPWAQSLIRCALALRSHSLADLRRLLGNLPAMTLSKILAIFQEGHTNALPPGSTAGPLLDTFTSILHYIELAGSTIIVAVDNIHLLESFRGQFDFLTNALYSFNDHMVASMEVRFIVAGDRISIVFSPTSRGSWLLTQGHECSECLESLSFDEEETRPRQVSVAHPKTNNWIWTHPSYLRWSTSSAGILWIEGKPGSGKSVLAKSILTDIRTSRKVYTCYWFFSKRGGQALTSHASFLRSILHQLLSQDESLFVHFRDTYRQFAPKSVAHWSACTATSPWRFPAWESISTMQEILTKIITAGAAVQCIIDAMDEAQVISNGTHTRRELLNTLSNLVADASVSHFKVIVFSRPSLDIDLELTRHHQNYGNLHRIVLQVENNDTISMIVDTGITSLREAMNSWRADI